MFGYKIVKEAELELLRASAELLPGAKKESVNLMERNEALTKRNNDLVKQMAEYVAIPLENESLRSQVTTLKEAHNAMLAENRKLRQENAMLWHDNRELRALKGGAME